MGLEFFTGFEGCNSSGDAKALFPYSNGEIHFSATGGYNNGKRARVRNGGEYMQVNCTPGKTKVYGGHIIFASLGTYNTNPEYTFLHIPECNISVWNDPMGLDIRSGATQLATVPGVIIPPEITHVEIKVYSHATEGTLEIKINGVSVASLTGINTGGADITQMRFYGTPHNGDISWDNIFVADDWQGELISVLCSPVGDTQAQFTPLAGTDNFAMVDESGQDGDTTYVASSTVGNQDLYGFSAVPAGQLVKGVTLVTVARKDVVGPRKLQPCAVQDTTEYPVGSEKVLALTYPSSTQQGSITTLPTAPDGTAWTRDKLNALSWGFKVTE